jgi:hypothetical protein
VWRAGDGTYQHCSIVLDSWKPRALCPFTLPLAASSRAAVELEPKSSRSPPACWNLQLETEDSLLRRLILTPFGAARVRPHEAVARRSLIGYSHPSMELVAEIFIVIGAMLPGIVTVILEVSSHRLLSALVWTSFSVGLGMTATGILMLRRAPTKLLAEIFVVIGAMLPGMATVILEVSLHRPLSVLVGASLSVGSGLIAAGILMLRRQKPL